MYYFIIFLPVITALHSQYPNTTTFVNPNEKFTIRITSVGNSYGKCAWYVNNYKLRSPIRSDSHVIPDTSIIPMYNTTSNKRILQKNNLVIFPEFWKIYNKANIRCVVQYNKKITKQLDEYCTPFQIISNGRPKFHKPIIISGPNLFIVKIGIVIEIISIITVLLFLKNT